jgi:hypothetical protein
MNPIQFKKFIEEHPYVVWSLQQIQTGFVQNNLGTLSDGHLHICALYKSIYKYASVCIYAKPCRCVYRCIRIFATDSNIILKNIESYIHILYKCVHVYNVCVCVNVGINDRYSIDGCLGTASGMM